MKDDLIDVLADGINKKYKGEKIAYNLGVAEDSPSDIKEWVSTGSSILDLAISNRPHGGVPVGRITEITGLEQSGKSLVSAHLLANTQKKGGVAVYIDTENSVSQEYLRAIGVDVEKLLYVSVDTVERIFETIDVIIEKVRSTEKNRLVTIVVDSVAAASTELEMDTDYGKDGFATAKALIMSKSMRKITGMIGRERICLVFTNQLREKLGVMFGDKYTTSGGKALQFHASVRLRLKSIGKIKKKASHGDSVIGVQTRAIVIKNRLGPPQREADFDIYFDRGIDDYASWLKTLKNYGLVNQSGAWYTYTSVDTETGEVGEEHKFQAKDFPELLENNEELKENMYQQMCNEVIMTYRSSELDIDNTTIETEDE
jgi:recombination protein RecA